MLRPGSPCRGRDRRQNDQERSRFRLRCILMKKLFVVIALLGMCGFVLGCGGDAPKSGGTQPPTTPPTPPAMGGPAAGGVPGSQKADGSHDGHKDGDKK